MSAGSLIPSAVSVHWMQKSNFAAELAEHGSLVYVCEGDSMLPLLREKRDLLIIKPVQRRLRRFEIPLYRRDSGQYVLHRVLRVRKKDYILCGDNRLRMECGITDAQILGVLTAVVRNGKEYPLSGWRYWLYVYAYCGPKSLLGLLLCKEV